MPANDKVKKALSQIQTDPSKLLGLNIGNHANVKPGQYIPRADAQSAPELFLPNPPVPAGRNTYIVITLDIDAPFPSLPILGPILHWIQPGLQPTPTPTPTPSSATDHTLKLQSTAPFITNYIGPAPPPGSAPHRYLFLLYEEPDGFEAGRYAPVGGRGVGNLKRMWFDFDRWAGELGLGGLVAGCWFLSN
ncbi:hypothetical protein FQN52_004407 [Onygenales sp. PD_12]|nr:hypothetical protein FQN52_004407 [Onygenales sp. PD_12]